MDFCTVQLQSAFLHILTIMKKYLKEYQDNLTVGGISLAFILIGELLYHI